MGVVFVHTVGDVGARRLQALFALRVFVKHHHLVTQIVSLSAVFSGGEQPKITRSHVGRVGSLSNHRNVVFGQESLDHSLETSWCIVMMQLPHSCCPKVWSLALYSITKVTKDFQVVFFVNVLALCFMLVMHHSTGVKENGQHHFDVALHLPGLFWSGGCWMFPLWWLRLGFWVLPISLLRAYRNKCRSPPTCGHI